jgi:hypothetical protein
MTELAMLSKDEMRCFCGKKTHLVVENKCYSYTQKQDVIFHVPLCNKHREEWKFYANIVGVPEQ